jgi:hypothetical protein
MPGREWRRSRAGNNEGIVELVIEIVRFVSWDPQPGIVACELKDAEGQTHVFVDKIPVFGTWDVDEHTSYPVPSFLHCKILSRMRDAHGRRLVRVRTDGVETTAGLSEFVVLEEQVSEENTETD